jgi:predicted SpoU family rRNA methylase
MPFLAITRYDSGSDSDYVLKDTLEEAVQAVHDFFLSYDFEIKGERPFDPSHEDFNEGGFKIFSNIIMYGEKVQQFTHCDGDGPEGEIREV